MLVQKKGKLKSIRKWKNNWYVLNLIFHPSSFTDTTLISTSCTVLDQILDYMFERLTRPADVSLAMCREPEGDKWKSALEQDPDVLYEVFWIVLFIKYGPYFQLLTSILSQLLFEEVKCQWSMSRPLLGLIILNMQSGRYDACKSEFINQQPPQFQPALQQVQI